MNKISCLCVFMLLFLITSCNKLPDTWGADSDFNPFQPHEIHYETKTLYLYANSPSWIDSRMVYNPVYKTTIAVHEDNPGYTGEGGTADTQQYKATASGTVVLCPQRNSLQPGLALPGVQSNTQRFTENRCQYINGRPITYNNVGNNSGKVEYVISDTAPPNSQRGDLIEGQVPYMGTNVLGGYIESPQAGRIWLRIVDEDGNYQENYGRYKVIVKQPASSSTPGSFLSKLINGIINPITRQIDMISQTMFENGEHSAVFKNIIRILLLLYIMFYGVGLLIGTQQITHRDLLVRLIKIGVILTLMSDTGINFFNEYLFNFLKNGQRELLNIVSNPQLAQMETGRLNIDSLFGFTNFVLTTIFSKHFFSILMAFLLWFPIGWVCLIMLLYTVIVYIFAILEVIIMYVIAYTAIGLFIALGPLFIPLMLFERTKSLFNEWISAMVSYTMQPVVMFATILLITAFINETIYNLLTLKLHSTPIFEMYIDFGIKKLTLFTIYWINPVDPVLQVLTDILIFYLFIELLKKVTKLSTDLSQYIFGRTAGAGVASEIMGNIKTGINAAVGAPFVAADSMRNRRSKGGEDEKGSSKKRSGDKNISSGVSVSKRTGVVRPSEGISVSKPKS